MIALAALLAPLAMSPQPAHAALACPPSKPAVAVTIDAPPPTIDNSLPQPALQQLAGRAHHGGRTLGLYRAEFKAHWRVIMGRRNGGAFTCRWVENVAVDIAIVDRKIYVVHARHPGTCPYESVLAHERKHEAADNAVLAAYGPRLERYAARTIADLPPPSPLPRAQGDQEEARLTKAVARALQRGLDAMSAARDQRQTAIDSPREYSRVRAACG